MTPKRIAIVGCGAIAGLWADALLSRNDAKIVALVDPDGLAARAFAERYGIDAPVFDGIETALETAQPDVVCNITPPEMHTRINLVALEHGCDVFCEKPLATSMTDARSVVDAALRAGRRVSVMQNRRFHPRIRAVAEVVGSGDLGPPVLIAADYFMNLRFGGFREVMENPLLLDMAIHHFDQARLIALGRAVRVSAVEANPKGSPFGGNAVAVCTFEMDDGSVFSYRGSWATPGLSTPWAAAWRIAGPAGTVTWDGEDDVRLEVAGEGPVRTRDVPTPLSGRTDHAGCIDEMMDAVTQGRPAETDGADNLHSLAMVHAAVASARLRGPVEVEA